MMRCRFCFTFILLLLFARSYAQSPRVEEVLQWYQKGYYILNPAIANTQREIAFVRQLSGKDSTIPLTSFLRDVNKNYLPKSTIQTRLYDPVICVLNENKQFSLIDYGWAPTFSAFDKRIAYAYQLQPLQKRDPLFAEAYKGNSIKVFSRATGQIEEVAKPLGNYYLLDPFFTDSLHLVYKTGTQVNGPYGAAISFNEVNLINKKINLIRQPAITYRLYELMGDTYLFNNKLAYTVYSPTDSGKGMANEYLHLLLSGKDTLQNFGIRRFTNLNNKIAFNTQKELIFLDDDQLLPEDTSYIIAYKNNEPVRKSSVNYKYQKSYLSPTGKYLLYITEKNEAYILNTHTSEQVQLHLPTKEYHAVAWSADGSKLAVVQDHEAYVGTDVLHVLLIN